MGYPKGFHIGFSRIYREFIGIPTINNGIIKHRCLACKFIERNGQQTMPDYQGAFEFSCSHSSCAKRLGSMYSLARYMSFCRVSKIDHLLTGNIFCSIMPF